MQCTKFVFALVLLALMKLCFPVEAEVLPETEAGKVFSEWMSVSNGGNRQAMQAFIAKTKWKRDVDVEMAAREDSGGQDVVEVLESSSQMLVAKIRNRKDGTELMVKLVVADEQPPRILLLGAYEITPGAKYEPYVMTHEVRQHVVDEVRKALTDTYVDAAIGKVMANEIGRYWQEGRYEHFQQGELLAGAISDDLKAISHDQHLNLYFYLFPQSQPISTTPNIDAAHQNLRKRNCGFSRAEHLSPNIGYLKINSFDRPDICGETASAAIGFIADSDALIIDLRTNGGGVPGMVAFIETYLFDQAVHLNDIYIRKENTTHQFWSSPYVPGKRLTKIPVYVLTSKDTFSAAEEFAYTLKSLKRAKVIGETTAGGAHPYDTVRIDDHFSFEVPFARSINPITHADWEGVGVTPDVKVSSSDALMKALSDIRSLSTNQ